MRDVDAMIEKLLDMEIVGEDNSITFTDEAKQLNRHNERLREEREPVRGEQQDKDIHPERG